MSILIKNWSVADWEELLKWAKIGANNAMIGEFAEVEELQQKQGKWLDVQDPLDIYVECECSLCHERYFKLSNSKDFRWIPFNYCPNCGARMVKDEDK